MNRRAVLAIAVAIAVVGGLWLAALRGHSTEPLPDSRASVDAAAAPATTPRALAGAAPVATPPAGDRATPIPSATRASTASATMAREELPERLRQANARLEQLRRCHAAFTRRSDAERLSEWAKSLPDAAVSAAEGDYDDALAWAGGDCLPLLANLPAGPPGSSELALLLAAGYRLDDPLVQLQRERANGPAERVDANRARAALDAAVIQAVAAPDVAQFRAIARVGASLVANREIATYMENNPEETIASVWALAACDLGANCGPRSAALRMICLTELLCGYPSVEAAMIDAYWPQGLIATLSVMRRDLTSRLRAGAGAGVFGPAAPGGG